MITKNYQGLIQKKVEADLEIKRLKAHIQNLEGHILTLKAIAEESTQRFKEEHALRLKLEHDLANVEQMRLLHDRIKRMKEGGG